MRRSRRQRKRLMGLSRNHLAHGARPRIVIPAFAGCQQRGVALPSTDAVISSQALKGTGSSRTIDLNPYLAALCYHFEFLESAQHSQVNVSRVVLELESAITLNLVISQLIPNSYARTFPKNSGASGIIRRRSRDAGADINDGEQNDTEMVKRLMMEAVGQRRFVWLMASSGLSSFRCDEPLLRRQDRRPRLQRHSGRPGPPDLARCAHRTVALSPKEPACEESTTTRASPASDVG
jgi:hypothetical protein